MTAEAERAEVVEIVYTNHRGITEVRHIHPQAIHFGANTWHPEPQWLLDAYDVGRQVGRSFALANILCWRGQCAENGPA